MNVEYLNYESGIGFEIYNKEHRFIDNVLSIWQNIDINILVVRELWIDDAEFSKLLKEFDIENINLIIAFSLMDDAHLNLLKVEERCPVLKIGYYKNQPLWFDFLSLIFNESFSLHKDFDPSGSKIHVPFMCLNGKPHYHRTELVELLRKHNLIHEGYVSYDSQSNNPKKIILDSFDENGIIPTPYDPVTLGDIKLWNNHFLNIVTETLPDPENNWFWTEKTFKPIVGLRPFLTYAPNNNNGMLEAYGFLSYAKDFKDITDLDLTDYKKIPKFLKTLAEQPENYYQHKYKILYQKLLYNRENFKKYIQEQSSIIEKLRDKQYNPFLLKG